MAPPLKPFDAKAAERYAGKGGVKQYFKVVPKPKPQPAKRKRGRPKKKRKAAALALAAPEVITIDDDESIEPVPGPDIDAPTVEENAPRKKSRTNWGKRENRTKMEKAINDWVDKSGDIYDNNGEMIDDWKVFANKVGIPPDTFYKYIRPKNPKQLGDGSWGKKKLMTEEDIEFAGCVLARADRGNDGLSSKESIDMIQELLPNISRDAARKQTYRYVLPLNHAIGILKRTTQKVQGTTSDRTNINFGQQYRWHRAVDKLYDFLRTNNTGLCKLTGKSFGEVMPDFLIGLDEMCLMSDAHGDLRVVASADKKKQEKLLQDCRCSITVVRTGTMSGTTGPTYFLLKGATRKKSFTDAYLVKYGMKPGSTIIMTENAYMTDDAWLQVSKEIVKGYRLLPVIRENPEWYIAELLDGFKSHENVLGAHELLSNARIIWLKEESNSSHVNQGYDQLVAKYDKKNAAESLYDQRKAKKWVTGKTTINQYDLVHTAMRIVRLTDQKTWVASFERCNLHPWTRKAFPEFCKKISSHLRAGDTFKDDNVEPTAEEKFAVLPSFWHGMTPADRKVVMTVFQSHASQYTTACLKMLHVECKLPYSQMNDVRVCVLVSREHPESLDFDINQVLKVADVEAPGAVIESKAGKTSLNDNLYHLMLNPKDDAGNAILKGEALFDHMCRFRNMKHASAKGKGLVDDDIPRLEPSKGLAVHLYDDSLKHIQPSSYDLRRGAILKDYIGNNALRKSAKRKLNSYAYIVGNCGIVNSQENMRRMREQLIMAESVAEISRLEAEDKEVEKRAKHKVHDESAPAAAAKLEAKGRVVDKLTRKEIEAILFRVYNVTLGGSTLRKPDFVNALVKEMASSIGKYEDYLALLATKVISAIEEPPALAPAIDDAGIDEDEEKEDDDPVSDVAIANDDKEEVVEGSFTLNNNNVDDEESNTLVGAVEEGGFTLDNVDDDEEKGIVEGVAMLDDNEEDFVDEDGGTEWNADIVDANIIDEEEVGVEEGDDTNDNTNKHVGVRASGRQKRIPDHLKECWF
jgi:hypothetical protein